jgi:hypothetical protein
LKKVPNEQKTKFNRNNHDTYLKSRTSTIVEKYEKEKSQIIWKFASQSPVQGNALVLSILKLNHEFLLEYGELEICAIIFGLEKNKIADSSLQSILEKTLIKNIGRTNLRFSQELSMLSKKYQLSPSTTVSIDLEKSNKWANTLNLLLNKMREQIIVYNKNTEVITPENSSMLQKKVRKEYYINPQRIQALKEIETSNFNFEKLIKILHEINICFQYGQNYALIILQRAILDHIPPVFGRKTFANFINHLELSERKYFKKLDDDLRDLADISLHKQIRKRRIETPTIEQIDFSKKIDNLLGMIIIEIEHSNNNV